MEKIWLPSGGSSHWADMVRSLSPSSARRRSEEKLDESWHTCCGAIGLAPHVFFLHPCPASNISTLLTFSRLQSIPITMLSLRALTRSVPRAASHFTARTAYRQILTPHTLRISPATSLARAAPRLAAAFSMSSSRSQGISGDLVSFVHRSNRFSDEVLAEKLNNEITYEKNFSQSEKSNRAAQRANIDSFLQQQGFEVR